MNNLLQPTQLKNISLKNHLFKSASWEDLADEEGRMTPELFRIYEELAAGGVGGIITGYAYVHAQEKPNPGMMGIYDDSFIEEYQALIEMVHSYGARLFLQVAYGGSMSGLKPASPLIWGPSAVTNEATGITPTAMTTEDMTVLKDDFAQAARRAEAAGFDGVQLHCAHGYMLSHFLSGDYNKREDEYGGCIENRARLLVEIVQAMRSQLSADFVLMVKLNSEDFTSHGLTQDESIQVAQMLEAAGVDLIEVSGGNSSSLDVIKNNLATARSRLNADPATHSYFAPYAKRLVEAVSIPVMLVGGNRQIRAMETLHQESGIAFFSMTRALICEPDLANKWYENVDHTARCVTCNGCFRTKGKRCVLNMKRRSSVVN